MEEEEPPAASTSGTTARPKKTSRKSAQSKGKPGPKKWRCECGKSFAIKSQLERHTKDCTGADKTFRCRVEECTSAFRTDSELRKHEKRIHFSEPVQCTYEGCTAMVKKHYMPQHILLVHEKQRTECDKCGIKVFLITRHKKICGRRKVSKKVVDRIIPAMVYRCRKQGCTLEFDSPEARKAHVNETHNAPIMCPHPSCGVIVRAAGLASHRRKVHKVKMTICGNCGKLVKQYVMRKHLETCGVDEANFLCPESGCKKAFKGASQVRDHLRCVHRKPIQCPREGCDAVINPSSLGRHLRFVHDKRYRACEACGKLYSALEKHRQTCQHFTRSQSREKLQCSYEGCKKYFYNNRYLALHVRRVHTHNPYVRCSVEGCDARVRSRSLRAHISGVHLKINKVCPLCEKELRVAGFWSHIKICSGQDIPAIYKCPKRNCGKSFKRMYERSRHINIVHCNNMICPLTICNAVFKESNLIAHLRTQHPGTKLKIKNPGNVRYTYNK